METIAEMIGAMFGASRNPTSISNTPPNPQQLKAMGFGVKRIKHGG